MRAGLACSVLTGLAGCGFQVAAGVVDPDAHLDGPADVRTDGLVPCVDPHDEDGDGKGDNCDACPQFPNQDTDSDGDGVGDACDPHPSTPGDALVRFEGFHTASTSLPSGFTQLGGFTGDWDVMQDNLEVDTQDTPHLIRFDAGASHVTIMMALDVSLPGANVPSITAIVDGDATLSSYEGCSVLYTEQSRRLQSFTGGAFTPLQTIDGTVTVPGPHRLTATIDVGAMSCTFTPGAQLQDALTTAGRTFVGLRIRNLRSAIHWIAIYRSP